MSKWLEERWKVFLPALAKLSRAQEEQIKRLCEEELLMWKVRPSMKQANSLRKPLTETRNRIRESIPVTEENGWINPKSNELEHLALKYLNFSTEEWVQMNLPPQEELQARLTHAFPLPDPSALCTKVEQLLQMKTWPEMVVGIGLSTGRTIVEIVHTGHFTVKTAYSVLFAGPLTVYERLCDPFEVPTLVTAHLVMDAVKTLRELFGEHFVGVERRDISRQCTTPVCEAAYRHLLGVIPFPSQGQFEGYKRMTRGVYSRLATLYYCPAWMDEILYMAMIQNHRNILEAKSEEERLTFALAAGYREYVVLDGTGAPDRRQGIRLGEPGVEVLSALQEKMPDVAASPGYVWTLEEVKAAIAADRSIDDDWDEEDLEVLCLSMSMVIVDPAGNIDQRRGIKLGEPGVEVLEVFRQSGREEGKQRVSSEPEADAEPKANVSLEVDELTALAIDAVQAAEGEVPICSIQRELGRVQRLLACFIFEVQVNLIENDPPTEILDTLATLVNHAPPSVMELVERLRRTPLEEQEDDYPCILPSFQDVSVEQLTPESLGLEASVVGKIREGMERSHEQDFKVFLSKALVKEAHIRIGMAQRYKEVDLTGLATSELEKQHKSAELTQERIRRAVIALMLYNQQQSHPKLRARITQTAVHDLMGGRFDHIREFLEKHQEVIAEHHRNLEVPEKRSARVDLSAIRIPEESEAFGSLFLSQPELERAFAATQE